MRARAVTLVLLAFVTAVSMVTFGEGVAHAGPRADFQMPFGCGETWYGHTRTKHRVNDYPLDFNRPAGQPEYGQPVVASASGSARQGVSNSGAIAVIVDHGGGWSTDYRHLSSIAPGVLGTTVRQGQLIGYVGNTGGVNTHLHYEQRLNGTPQPIWFNGSPLSPGYSYVEIGPAYTSRNSCSSENETSGSGRLRADFTGDGRADVGVLQDYGTGQERLFVFASNGSSFAAPRAWWTGQWQWAGAKLVA